MNELQSKVRRFVQLCFGRDGGDVYKHVRQFAEQSAKFARSCGLKKDEHISIIEKSYNNDESFVSTDCGDLMVSLAIVCNPLSINIANESIKSVERCFGNIDLIRAKYLTPIDLPTTTINAELNEYINAIEKIAPWLSVIAGEMIANPALEFLEACDKIFELDQKRVIVP